MEVWRRVGEGQGVGRVAEGGGVDGRWMVDGGLKGGAGWGPAVGFVWCGVLRGLCGVQKEGWVRFCDTVPHTGLWPHGSPFPHPFAAGLALWAAAALGPGVSGVDGV